MRTAGLWRPAVVAFLAAAAVGAAVRAWQIGSRTALTWSDSVDFLTLSAQGWTSAELWAGVRAPGVPLVAQDRGRKRRAVRRPAGRDGGAVLGRAAPRRWPRSWRDDGPASWPPPP